MTQQENDDGLLSKPWFPNVNEKPGKIMGAKKMKADVKQLS
jgi:hypothetical protein